jgi:aminoglycoside 3'-phosphotransferase II
MSPSISLVGGTSAAFSTIGFPASWSAVLVDGATVERQTISESRADVFRIRLPRETCLFVKSELDGPLSELPEEIERLRWMQSMGLPC